MSITDESQVPHRPPRVGDRVEVRLTGSVVEVRSGLGTVSVLLEAGQLVDYGSGVWVTCRTDEVAILRDVPTYQPGHADHP